MNMIEYEAYSTVSTFAIDNLGVSSDVLSELLKIRQAFLTGRRDEVVELFRSAGDNRSSQSIGRQSFDEIGEGRGDMDPVPKRW